MGLDEKVKTISIGDTELGLVFTHFKKLSFEEESNLLEEVIDPTKIPIYGGGAIDKAL
jgi:hypothetical protein